MDIVTQHGVFQDKVELHVHLDGSVRPETILELASMRGMPAPANSVEELKEEIELRKPESLSKLIKSFNTFLPTIIGSRDAVYRIAYEFCEDSAKEGIRYTEVRYSPHLLSNSLEKLDFPVARGNFTPRDVVTTVNAALEKGSRDFDINVKTILACMAHRPEWSLETVKLCREFKGYDVVGIDVAGEEFIPGKDPGECLIKQAFKEAFDCDIHRTVHAGEVGPAAAVREALDHMYAERIGHGYHVLQDSELYERVRRENIHLELCPMSSIRTRACSEDIWSHPMLRFMQDDANVSINTDDPTILDNTLTDDYVLARNMGLTDKQIIKTIFNAARACFAPDNERRQLVKDLVKRYGEY